MVAGDRLLRQKRVRLAFAEMICANVPSDLVHPCPEFTVLTERAPILEHSEKDFLREVLARSRIGCHPVKESKQTIVVSLKELTKPVYLSVSDGEHQAVIGQHRICRREDRQWKQTLQIAKFSLATKSTNEFLFFQRHFLAVD